MTLKNLRLVFFVFASLMANVVLSHAAVSLSITPIDGGTGIRFDRVSPGLKNTKILQIRVNSTSGQKYQVFQRVFEPIINEKGQQLNLSSIETATLPSSSSGGTLYLQTPDRLTYNEQLIFTSGHQGESDSFKISYNVIAEAIKASGNFRGRLVFTVRSLGVADQTETTVDFYLEIPNHLEVSIRGGHERNRIRIKDSDTEIEKSDYVKVSFDNVNTEEVKLYQELFSPLTSDTGIELPLDVIRMSVQGGGSNVRLSKQYLSQSPNLLYEGSADEEGFAIYFLINPDSIQKAEAGLYRGQMKYTIEAGGTRQEVIMDIQCYIQPLFTLDVTLPPEGVSFGHVLANSPSQEKQVLVTVRTNLHKPYQVMQNVPSLMVNEHGKEFNKKYFSFKVDLGANPKGHTQYSQPASVEMGDYPIYSSNSKGDPVSFYVTYELKGYYEMDPGNFVAPLKFSLNQN